MKIGEFSEHFGVSRDTVRHYCKLGLLIPDNSQPQVRFTERECQDMERILRMKDQNFSLVEIRKYLDILRVSTMVEPESIQEVITLLNQKRSELEQQAKSMLQVCATIDQDIRALSDMVVTNSVRSGVPLNALPLLSCPFCGMPLELDNASISQNYIHKGDLRCRCGYHAKIDEGIVLTGNLYTGQHDAPDLHRGLYRDVSDEFVIYLQRCTDFALRTLQNMDLHHRVILENHINGYFFLYNNLRLLEPDCTYIIVDKYPEMLQMYKRNIDKLGLRLNILYIADATNNLPLRHGAADVLISFMGGNEHSLYNRHAYIHDMKPFLSPKAIVVGTTLGFHRDSKSLSAIRVKYPEGDGNGFCYEEFSTFYRAEGYAVDQQPVGVMRKTSNRYSFECHLDGEELIMSHFLARPMYQNL